MTRWIRANGKWVPCRILKIDIHTAIMDVITDVWDRAKQINEATYEILDLIEANRKKFGRNDNDHCKRRGEPVAKVRNRGFEVVDGKHVPTVLVEFPVDDWESRDRFAAAVAAPHPLSESDIPAEPDKQHPDDVAVGAFAAAMKAKLKRAREEKGRGGWQDMSATELSAMLREHVEKGDPVDVANLAMMLHQNGQGITPAAPVKSHLKVSYDDKGDCL